MGRSGSLQSLHQAEGDEGQTPRALGGSSCSPLFCSCGCFLCTETFCGMKWNYRDVDAVGLRWPKGLGRVCWWNFSLLGLLSFHCLSRQQRWAPRCRRKALPPIPRLIGENREVQGHSRTRSGSPVGRLGSQPPADCLRWHQSGFPRRENRVQSCRKLIENNT